MIIAIAVINSLYQWTPLHMAANGGHEATVKYLVEEKQADINIKGSEGVSI